MAGWHKIGSGTTFESFRESNIGREDFTLQVHDHAWETYSFIRKYYGENSISPAGQKNQPDTLDGNKTRAIDTMIVVLFSIRRCLMLEGETRAGISNDRLSSS